MTRQPQSPSTSLSGATIEAGVDAYGRMLGNYTIQEIVSEIYLAMKAKEEASPADEVEPWPLAQKLYAAHCTYHGHGDGSRWKEEPATSQMSWANLARAALSAIRNGDEGMREALEQIKFAGEHPNVFKSDRQMWEAMADIARAAIAEDTQ